MPTLSPTAEQTAIITAAAESPASLMISAYAGTAKTTTIEMLSKSLPKVPTLALAFNVKIKEELEKRLPSSFTVKTLNGLGHGAWMRATGKKMTLETGKIGKLINTVAKTAGFTPSKEQWITLKDLVNAARQEGLVPSLFPHGKGHLADTSESWQELAEDNDLATTPTLCDLARAILIESVKQAYSGLIDFDDQIYMSVCFGGVFPRFHTVICDEAQDLSTMNHIMLSKCVTERLIICGDPKQSLYAFRGAASDSMGKIRALRPDWLDFPLTLTFRCPAAIVARQHHHAPGYRAAATNLQGAVIDYTVGEASTWRWPPTQAPGKVAVLCRNVAPLISMAFKLIRQGVGCSMLGRDLGKGLLLTIKKLPTKELSPIVEVVAALTAWKDRESAILRANGNNSGLEKLEDRYDSILAVVESSPVKTQAELCLAISALFSRDKELVVLSSIHRAKGLEWSHVVLLDPWRLPSKWAKNPEALLQETNAQYVAETRAKETLILANLKDFT